MNNYSEVLKIAKDLQEEYPQKLTLVESLEIAAKIRQIDIISEGLLVRGVNTVESKPVALEAIAMVLGYKEGQFSNGTIIDAIQDKST